MKRHWHLLRSLFLYCEKETRGRIKVIYKETGYETIARENGELDQGIVDTDAEKSIDLIFRK